MSKTESDATRAWPRLRATLRIARRDAARSKGRALLVILMIGLPVMAVTAGATLVESSVLTPARMADEAMGVEGQARITWTGLTSLQQAPHEQMWAAEDAGPDLSLADVEAGLTERLPAGAVLERMFTEADAAQATSGEGSEDLSMPGEAEPDWRWTVKAAEVPWATVLEINDFGGLVLSRAVILDPPADADVPYFQSAYSPTPDTGPNATLVMAIALAVFVGAEVILIIGPAFAIGARRTERQLALIAASGGDRRTLRQVVLLGGWFMGAIAAVGGVAAGLLLALLIRWIVRLKSPASMPDLQIPVWLILAIGVTGTVLAAAASWLPARRAAKVDVVAALSGRSKTPKPGGSAPVWAAALIIVGTGLAAFGAIKQVPAAMAGIALIMVGLVLGTGEIVAVVGRLAPRMGPATRFSLRDANRRRTRTAPAIAAVMAAVAGIVAVSVYIESGYARDTAIHRPLGSHGSVIASFENRSIPLDDPAVVAQIEKVLAENLPLAQTAVVQVAAANPETVDPAVLTTILNRDGYVELTPLIDPAQACPTWGPPDPDNPPDPDAEKTDPRCQFDERLWVSFDWGGAPGQSKAIVDDGTLMDTLGLPKSAEAAALLRAGKVVVNDPRHIWADGKVRLSADVSTVTFADPETPAPEPRVVEGALVELGWHNYGAIVPPALLVGTDLAPQTSAVLASTTREPTEAEQMATAAALRAIDPGLGVTVERGFQGTDRMMLWILAALAALIGLGTTGISVALAAAEARPDLSTLSAIGASPRTRRKVVGAQAGLITGVGSVLGVGAGVGIAWIIVLFEQNRALGQTTYWTLQVPGGLLAAIAVGLPVLATVGAYVFTRSRLPLTHRVEQ